MITCSQDSKISIQRRPRWSEYKGKSGPSSITHPTIPSTKQQPTNHRFDQNARPLQYCRPRAGRHQRYSGRKKAVFSAVAWTQSSIWRTQIAEYMKQFEPPSKSKIFDKLAGELISVDQSMLHQQLTVMMQSDASIRHEAARHYLPYADPLNPFGWSDDD